MEIRVWKRQKKEDDETRLKRRSAQHTIVPDSDSDRIVCSLSLYSPIDILQG